jgi:hypothetical protein
VQPPNSPICPPYVPQSPNRECGYGRRAHARLIAMATHSAAPAADSQQNGLNPNLCSVCPMPLHLSRLGSISASQASQVRSGQGKTNRRRRTDDRQTTAGSHKSSSPCFGTISHVSHSLYILSPNPFQPLSTPIQPLFNPYSTPIQPLFNPYSAPFQPLVSPFSPPLPSVQSAPTSL